MKRGDKGDQMSWKASSEIRRMNARLLLEKYGSEEFCRRAEMSKQQLSQYLGRHPTRNFGDSKARLIETIFKRPRNWLDNVHPEGLRAAETHPSSEPGSAHRYRLLLQRANELETLLAQAKVSQEQVYDHVLELCDHIKRLHNDGV